MNIILIPIQWQKRTSVSEQKPQINNTMLLRAGVLE
jgi:hypothetical protein